MSDQDLEQYGAHADDIDADVVCQECEFVNAPGTLICRQCGNNLRDQRVRRLAALHEGELTDKAERRTRFLTGLLSVLGLLTILYVSLNVGNIEKWMTGVQSESGRTDPGYWSGNQGATFDSMVQALQANPPTKDQMDAAQNNPPAFTSFEGRYLLTIPTAIETRVIGVASVRKEGTKLYYCAILNDGSQVRGIATEDTADRISTTDGVLDRNGDRMAGVGFAQRTDQGTLTIIVAGDETDDQFRAVAYRLPD